LKEIRAGILITSDRSAKGERPDASGKFIIDAIKKLSGSITEEKIVPDDRKTIADVLKDWADSGNFDVIITSGGTGFSPRDNTPEATRSVIEKEAPGIAELIRSKGALKTERAYLSRGISGIRNRTLIINLPGSPGGVKDSMEAVSSLLHHAVEVLRGEIKDCFGKNKTNHLNV